MTRLLFALCCFSSLAVGLRIHSTQLFGTATANETITEPDPLETAFWRSEETGSMESILASVDAKTRSEMTSALEAGVDAESVRQLWSYPFGSVAEASTKCKNCFSDIYPFSCGDPVHARCTMPEAGPYLFGAKSKTPCSCMILFPYSEIADSPEKSTLLNQAKGLGPIVQFAIMKYQRSYKKALDVAINKGVCMKHGAVVKYFDKRFVHMFDSIKNAPADSGIGYTDRQYSDPLAWVTAFFEFMKNQSIPKTQTLEENFMTHLVNHAWTYSNCTSPNCGTSPKPMQGQPPVHLLWDKFSSYMSDIGVFNMLETVCTGATAPLKHMPGLSSFLPKPLSKTPMVCFLDRACHPVMKSFALSICSTRLVAMTKNYLSNVNYLLFVLQVATFFSETRYQGAPLYYEPFGQYISHVATACCSDWLSDNPLAGFWPSVELENFLWICHGWSAVQARVFLTLLWESMFHLEFGCPCHASGKIFCEGIMTRYIETASFTGPNSHNSHGEWYLDYTIWNFINVLEATSGIPDFYNASQSGRWSDLKYYASNNLFRFGDSPEQGFRLGRPNLMNYLAVPQNIISPSNMCGDVSQYFTCDGEGYLIFQLYHILQQSCLKDLHCTSYGADCKISLVNAWETCSPPVPHGLPLPVTGSLLWPTAPGAAPTLVTR